MLPPDMPATASTIALRPASHHALHQRTKDHGHIRICMGLVLTLYLERVSFFIMLKCEWGLKDLLGTHHGLSYED